MERISSGGRELKVAILFGCGVDWNGMEMDLMGYPGHYIAWGKTLVVGLTFETTDESIIARWFILWFVPGAWITFGGGLNE